MLERERERERERESKTSAKSNGRGNMLNIFAILKSVRERKKYSNSSIVKAGFTLVELAIVLVIIGLVFGGVMVGKDLIRAAEIRSVISQEQQYIASYNTFRNKYNCIPGDCANATAFWGAENANAATCQTTASYGSLTCDGNGNGQVADVSYEMFRFWQHLALAGLIKGQYTGVAGSGGSTHHVIGTNCPSTALSGVGFAFGYWNFISGVSNVTYAINYGNYFTIGKEFSTGLPINAIFTPAEAYAFDQKIDDGKPATGLAIARSAYTWNNSLACTTSLNNTDFTGSYKTSHNTVSCYFHIKTGEY